MNGSGLQLFYENGQGDIAVKDGRLVMGNSLNTVVLTSLFSNRRVEDNDQITVEDIANIENGYWAESLMSNNKNFWGSRHWQFIRSTTAKAVTGLQQSAVDGTKWLKDLGIVSDITVQTNRVAVDRIEQVITYTEPTGETTEILFKNLWEEIRSNL